MNKLFRVDVVYSTSHWIVPRIIITILVVLGVIIAVTEGMARRKKGEPFFGVRKAFFIEHYDKLKFWGTLALFVCYILAMDLIGFLPASIVFIFLFNLLFCASREPKSILISLLISVVSSVLIWYVFGIVFNVTLPAGLL